MIREYPFWVWFIILLVFSLILSIFFFFVIFILPSDPINPNCSIEYFYVPALNKTLNSQLNTTLNFMLLLNNLNYDRGIYYDDVHLSFFDKTNSSIANYTVPRFYQGYWKKAKKWGQVLPVNNETVLRAVLPNGSAVFRLELKTQVRFKRVLKSNKRYYSIEVGADVVVNGDGVKANNKGIKMNEPNSASPSLKSYFPVCILVNLLVFLAI